MNAEDFIEGLRARLAQSAEAAVERNRRQRVPGITEAYLRAQFGHFKGCTEAEITRLMQAQGVKTLPALYRQFLRVMGHRSGGVLFAGGDAHFEHLKRVKEIIGFVLSDCEDSPLLPDDVFIFVSYHDAEFFLFFTAPRCDDPPVFCYAECESEFEQVSDHLSLWLLDRAARCAVEG